MISDEFAPVGTIESVLCRLLCIVESLQAEYS